MAKTKPHLKKLLQKEMSRKDFLSIGALATISLLGIGGVIEELLSHASTPYSSTSASKGTLTGNAKSLAITGAASGNAVEFEPNATPTPTPPPNSTNPSGIAMPVGNLTTAGGSWTQVMADDFTGTKLNSANWDAPYSNSHPGNDPGQGTWLASHVSVSNSMLILNASVDNSFSNPSAGNWAFGGVYSAYGQPFGRWEVCIRADPLELVYILALIIGGEWPSAGEVCEIDYIEGASTNGTTFPAVGITVHYGSAPSQVQFQGLASWNDWNTVALEFTESQVLWYLNGNLVKTEANPAPNASQQTMYMTLQNQLETGTPPAGTPSGNYEIDWAVIYKPA